jgi:fucose permease
MSGSTKTVHTALYAPFALAGIATTMLGPLMPALQARWKISDSLAGLLFTAQFLASVCSAALVGVLARRFGYGQLIRFGLIIAGGGRGGQLCRLPLGPRAAVRGHLRLRAGLDHSRG